MLRLLLAFFYFGFEKPALKKIKEINKDIKPNKLLNSFKYVFKYSKNCIK